MFYQIYFFLRSGSGFSLVVAGLSLLLAPRGDRASKRLGLLFTPAGLLFCVSALDPVFHLPTDLGNLVVLVLILVMSQAFFGMGLYLFGDKDSRRLSRLALVAGIVWAALVLTLPLLDYAFGWGQVGKSAEDGSSLGPLHSLASVALYLWPLAVTAAVARISHLSFRGLSFTAPGTRTFVAGSLVLILVFVVVLLGLVLPSIALYRLGQTALEFLLISWYLISVARPDLFSRTRAEIEEARVRGLVLGMDEIALIGKRVAKIAEDSEVISRSGFDLKTLATLVKAPPYRLSAWFGARPDGSFPVWLNKRRVELVKARMLEEPGRPIIDIAMESGYSSKSAFNSQFARIVGMTPSVWRRGAGGKDAPDLAGGCGVVGSKPGM